MAKKKKKQKKGKLEVLVETAEELNKVLGLEPPIETEGVEEAVLEEKVREASRLVNEEDELTKRTRKITDEYREEEEPVDLPEEPDDEEILYLEEAREAVKGMDKRKDLRSYAKDHTDIFQPVVDRLGELKSFKALKGAMLSHISDLEGEDEGELPEETFEPEETEKPAKEKKKKKSTAKSAPGDKSNKAIVYEAWEDGEEDVDALWELVDKRVKRTTVRSWVNGWKNGRGLPAIAKEEEDE